MIKKLVVSLIIATLSFSTTLSAKDAQPLRDALSLVGPLTQGAMLRGQTNPNATLTLNGSKVALASDGQFVIGFGRDAKLEHQLQITLPGQASHTFDFALKKRDYKISRVTGISKKITHPSKKSRERASLDAKQVRAARKLWSDTLHFTQQFVWPVTGRISGVYGSQRFYNGKAGRPHFGLDIARPTGTVVNAPADGIVRLFVPDMFYSGGTLIIDHGMGVSSTFLHLSAGLVKTGDIVEQGQPIAKIGTTGRSTGPHLDWRMNWLSQRIDPQLLVKPQK